MSLSSLVSAWRDTPLEPWAERLPAQVERGLSLQRYGDLPRWQAALGSLPAIAVDRVNLDCPAVGATAAQPVSDALRASLQAALQGLHPWRKGPFDLFGVYIDAEWRSDWKWDRIAGEIAPLAGRRVLDVGCGSGYHGWRMLGAGAAEVIGIDPTPLFVLQFRAIQHYLQQPGIHVLPLAMQDVPPGLRAFDTVFSMGILYHRRSPLDHLLDLRDSLRPGGELVLETLVIQGEDGATLVPTGRYARMGNVWFLPSPATLLGWLRKLKFREPRLVDVSVTSTDEQRGTEWMRFHSLADFLDPADRSRTIEGYPAPRRAVVIAKAP